MRELTPFALGQCLEISHAVLRLLQRWLEIGIPENLGADVANGFTRVKNFLAAGGTLRSVWGDLRGSYFQYENKAPCWLG
ncbi:MAG: hypothetical protein HQL49_05140 [Gammaproteobacteria bacterium]|nr:hypothetical protein [Gammaproteobacteria bacterium]